MVEFTVKCEFTDVFGDDEKPTGERELWVQWTPKSGDPNDTLEFVFLMETIIGKEFDSGMMMQAPFTRDWHLPIPNDDAPLEDTGLTGMEQAMIKHTLDPDNNPNPWDEDE